VWTIHQWRRCASSPSLYDKKEKERKKERKKLPLKTSETIYFYPSRSKEIEVDI
jgi:hypothetical protein